MKGGQLLFNHTQISPSSRQRPVSQISFLKTQMTQMFICIIQEVTFVKAEAQW